MEHKPIVLMERYELGRLLGKGNFAKVYHARNIKTGMSVAIKVIDKEKVMKVGMIEQIKREISVMRLVKHPNIVQLYEVMASKSKVYFVMEHVKGGELFNKVSKGKLNEDTAKMYFKQLISAVDFCHSRGVYHRDLKLENVLLDEDGNLKVSDFGLSALAESKRQDGMLHTTCGTPAYVAPEVIGKTGYDGCKADIWSCGVILYVLLAGYLPFYDSNLMEMYRKVVKAEFKFPSGFPAEARRLVSKMLDPNPSTRISIAMIMQKPWFQIGFDFKTRKLKEAKKEPTTVGADVFSSLESTSKLVEQRLELDKLSDLNAFDIISLSAGFDLSCLFEKKYQKKEVRMTSMHPLQTIISKFEDIAKKLRLQLTKEGGVLKLEGSREGRKGVLSIYAEIFEITPDFHLVEVKKLRGDTLEYQKVVTEDIEPALKDIVCTWQGYLENSKQ